MADNVPPAGRITDNVDMHVQCLGQVLHITLYPIDRDSEGYEHTDSYVLSHVEVTLKDGEPVPLGFDEWFSYRQYQEDREDRNLGETVDGVMTMAGEFGLKLVRGMK